MVKPGDWQRLGGKKTHRLSSKIPGPCLEFAERKGSLVKEEVGHMASAGQGERQEVFPWSLR